jgi:hypothetical protein
VRRILSIVWSPRQIEESLVSHEQLAESLDIDVAFITGMTEHAGCDAANKLARDSAYDLFLLSYDDQVVAPWMLERLLEEREEVAAGDVVSGWQVLGQNVPWAAATYPEWGNKILPSPPNAECFYTAEYLRDLAATGDVRRVRSNYFAAMTLVPRETLLESPIWALPAVVGGGEPYPNPDGSGRAYDKGCCSDWTLAIDILGHGHRVWVIPDVEVEHLSPVHNVPHYRFTIAEDDAGVFWGRRPR